MVLQLFFFLIYFYFWLCWVFVSVRGLSLVAASGGHSSSRCAGLSLSRPLLLQSTGFRRAGSVVVAHGPSCSVVCGIFPDQGLNPCSLHWQADSQPLRHQGSPIFVFLFSVFIDLCSLLFPFFFIQVILFCFPQFLKVEVDVMLSSYFFSNAFSYKFSFKCCFCCIPQMLICCVFIFIQLHYFLISPFISLSSLTHGVFRNMLFILRYFGILRYTFSIDF